MKKITYKNGIELTINYNVLTLRVRDKVFFAVYHINFSLEEVPELFYDLMMYILFYGMEKIDLPKYKFKNIHYGTLISYSGGADSTAIAYHFDGIPIHITRMDADVYENKQIKAVKQIEAIEIETNFENIRKIYKGKHGFNIGTGYAALYMPLIVPLKVNKIMFGTVFDDLAFNYGQPFRFNSDFSKTTLIKMRSTLQRFGIDFQMPLAGYSEVLSVKLANMSNINYSSCHVLCEGQKCFQCIKCFRKEAAQGRKIDLNDELLNKRIKKLFSIYPLKMAAVTVYGIKKTYDADFCKDIDLSFCERVNKSMQEQFFNGTKLPYFDWQTEQDFENIKKFVDWINSKEYMNYELK